MGDYVYKKTHLECGGGNNTGANIHGKKKEKEVFPLLDIVSRLSVVVSAHQTGEF